MNDIKKIKNIWIWFALFIAVFILFSIIGSLYNNEIISIDVFMHDLVVNNLRSDGLTFIMLFITNFCNPIILILLSLVILLICKDKKMGLIIIINLLVSILLNIIFKGIIQRDRPLEDFLIIESGYSFPSGHSMVSMAYYGLIIYFIYKKVEDKRVRNVLMILIGLLILAIGFSRIYLGVHFASDVIGGFLISIIYLVCAIKLLNLKYYK